MASATRSLRSRAGPRDPPRPGCGRTARKSPGRPEIDRIYVACRNAERASTAKAELKADVADPASVRAGLAEIDGSVNALVMNAGVIGPQSMALTADGVTNVFVTNVLGHVVLLEGAPGRAAVWRGCGLRRKRSSQGCPEVADEGTNVRLNLN
jgi:NAD(P)-dependent dehydrogenase (short-subunit alcohol dehydrogenase family)